jgi:hypothetical protein
VADAAVDDELSRAQRHLFLVEHQHDLAFEHDAEVERAGLLHVGMRRLCRIRARARRAHRLEISPDLALAGFAPPLGIRRKGEHVEYRAARRRHEHVRQMQRLVHELRREVLHHPHAVQREAGACRIEAHVGRGRVGDEARLASFPVDRHHAPLRLHAGRELAV